MTEPNANPARPESTRLGQADPNSAAPDGHGREPRRRAVRIAAWVGAGALLLAPLIAMAFTDAVQWTASDFIVAGALLFGSLGLYEVGARMAGGAWQHAGIGGALLATVLLVWGNGAVSITDSPADALYYGVAGIGLVGALLALRWPRIGAGALGATALALVGATGVTLALGQVPNPHVPTVELIGLTVFYGALFAGPAALLWTGARRGPA
jgi:hypothetical protein